MRNLLPDKQRYYAEFANAMYGLYRNMRWGIGSCPPIGGNKFYATKLRKEIVDYQAADDGDAFTQVSINYMGWLPVYYPARDSTVDSTGAWTDTSKYRVARSTAPGSSIGLAYPNGTTSTNLIEVNAGGCITRINVNPVINYNQNSSYVHIQSTAATVWHVVHNMGFVPNVFTEDDAGTDLSGVVTIVDGNAIDISFNSPVSGKAYLT